jgi:hypothetical protein
MVVKFFEIDTASPQILYSMHPWENFTTLYQCCMQEFFGGRGIIFGLTSKSFWSPYDFFQTFLKIEQKHKVDQGNFFDLLQKN